MLFDEYENVVVFDSKLAVGGIRFLVDEALKYQDESMEFVVEKLNQLVPRIVIAAMPETLDYLLAGGRLSKSSWMVGKLLSIIPIISFINGRVEVLLKKRGIKQCKRTVVDMIRMLPEIIRTRFLFMMIFVLQSPVIGDQMRSDLFTSMGLMWYNI